MTAFDAGAFRHIALEGVFHSGKTQWAGLLAERMGGKLVQDKTDNPYLKDFYDEKDGAAFLDQLVFLVNRYHQQSRLVQRELFEERILCDYIFEKDKIYAYQTLSDDELAVYDKIRRRVFRKDSQARPRHSSPNRPAHAARRISRQGSPLDRNISEKYLQDLIEAYDYFFFNYQATPLLVVKSDELDASRGDHLDDLIEQINGMKKTSLYYVPSSFDGAAAKKR